MSARTVALWAALLAAAPAQAYQQTQGDGVGLRWYPGSFTYKVNTAQNRAPPHSSPSCSASGTSDPALDAVKAAFAAWASATHPGDVAACTSLSPQYGGTSSSIAIAGKTGSEHLVVFRQGWCTANAAALADPCSQANPPTCDDKFNCFEDVGGMSRNVLALTTVMYFGGTIADADMEVVDWDGAQGQITTSNNPPPDGWYWTCLDPASQPQGRCSTYGQDGCYYMDLQNTVTHEAGHFIGLAHPCENDQATADANHVPLCSTNLAAFRDTTMFPSASTGETSKRTLAADDVNGVCAIYPLSGGTVPPPPSSRSSGGCGSGGATPVGLGALALALMALFPRARRRARR